VEGDRENALRCRRDAAMKRWFVTGFLLAVACGGADDGVVDVSDSGGAPSSGSAVGSGGITPSSGGASTGGNGAGAPGSGGASAMGGAVSAGGNLVASGGAPPGDDGGALPEDDGGGVEPDSGAGGSDDGGSGSGGAPGAGGSSSGGNVGTGGAASGGSSGSGGSPACECTTGPCCDGCNFREESHQCQVRDWSATECSGTVLTGPACAGMTRDVKVELRDRFCSGASAACDGRWAKVPGSHYRSCESGTACTTVGDGPTAAQCVPCGG
jgi:hypothetical protein